MTPRTHEQRNFKQNRFFVVNDPNAPRLSPSLAAEIGLNESIIFLQLEFWIVTKGEEIDGRLWVRLSLSDIQKAFPFWSKSTISRALENMVNRQLIDAENLNSDTLDKTKSYALNPVGINQLQSVRLIECDSEFPILQNENSILQNDTRVLQNEKSYKEVKELKNNTHTARENETKAPSSLLAPQGAPKREAPQVSPRIDTATATQAQPPKPDVHSVTTTPLIDLNNPDDPAFNSPHYRAVLTACRLDPELMSHRMRGRCAVAAAKLAKKYNPAQIEAIGAACPFQTAATPEQLGDNAESWLHPRVKEIAPRYPQPTFNTAGADFTQAAILDTQAAKERAALERAKAMAN